LLFCCSSALNIFNSMWLVALLANSMHPAIVLAPPLHPPRFQYALRPLPAMNRSMPSVPLPIKSLQDPLEVGNNLTGHQRRRNCGALTPTMLKPRGESIFSLPQYFPTFLHAVPLTFTLCRYIAAYNENVTHRPILLTKLAYVISNMANFYMCYDKQQ